MRWIYYSIFLASLIPLAFQREPECPRGWTRISNKCYRIVQRPSGSLLSRLFCDIIGGTLASINSVAVFDALSRDLINRHSSDNFWVSSTSKIYPLEVTSPTTMQTEYPDIWYSGISSVLSCVTFDGMVITERSCDELHGFICEHNVTEYKTEINCMPDSGWDSFIGEETGNCLFKSEGKVMRDDAENGCEENGGHALDLDQIMRDGLNNFYEHKVLANDGSRYWTALTWNGTHLLWRSGKVFDSYDSATRLIPFYPGRGRCVTVQFNFTDLLETHLYQTECEDLAYVVCAVETASHESTLDPQTGTSSVLFCPSGFNWKVYSPTQECFWETSYETSHLSWDEARAYCQGFGGDLASFHSAEEEKFGLSFQYGILPHPYWIGLRLDTESLTYKWSDGSPLTYENWAPGHPDHKDKTRQCVAMEAAEKHWFSSICGILSWFVCKAPQRESPQAASIPPRVPLVPCSDKTISPSIFYFNGYCYYVVTSTFSWHRAKQFCENEGSSLVSIHSAAEVGFILRLLYEEKGLDGNRVWIGLNTLSSAGAFSWTDWSAFDFTYWNDEEPNNYQNQEKCCNMYIRSGLWNDENCNAAMGFVCKRVMNATDVPEIPSTIDPRIGNCKKGWYAYHDRCYYPVGYAEKDRVNWTEAMKICNSHEGYLSSVRNKRDQAFLTYLMQGLKVDTWIGLHDTIQSGSYYWLDNSDMQYTNWAPGEPSFFGMKEDCVKMVYMDINSGVWKDDYCDEKLAYICQSEKDPHLPEPSYNRGIDCLYPEGWLKLEGFCFKMFAGNPMTWIEAENSCERDGGHLVSVTDPSVQAVVSYLSIEVNNSFWIGLQYEKSSSKVSWLNGWPVTISNWDNNQPTDLTEEACFSSSQEGYWKTTPCSNVMPYVCQITTGKQALPKQYTGNCKNTTDRWVSSKGSYCYIFEDRYADWYSANMRCLKHGSLLASMHSMDDIETIRKVIKPDARPFFIGLTKNSQGGFMWLDGSPVDFVNWDREEPESADDDCVEMSPDTMKWRVVRCTAERQFACASLKEQEVDETTENAKLADDSANKISNAALIGILVCAALAVIAIVAAVIYYKPLGRRGIRIPLQPQSVSFENALYNADTASMEFQDKQEDSLNL